MRRSLVLTDEGSRHPFLASLPPHARSGAKALRTSRMRQLLTLQDVKDFLLAYCACFVAVSLYIA
jgi:hypothetical protein